MDTVGKFIRSMDTVDPPIHASPSDGLNQSLGSDGHCREHYSASQSTGIPSVVWTVLDATYVGEVLQHDTSMEPASDGNLVVATRPEKLYLHDKQMHHVYSYRIVDRRVDKRPRSVTHWLSYHGEAAVAQQRVGTLRKRGIPRQQSSNRDAIATKERHPALLKMLIWCLYNPSILGNDGS
ncbi:uncharacterized protein FOMMEDRAFT_150711 [Fomitiporia mediterranea MF3/22]|uniref:uncharacterized protein n=1 Tax=Fomitiporia mediterranea (strain MF3/22) TaxID=694068 RepID=UPI0004408001|nr:uncharacterized protein FOMMEDRAFT_150711 [Fomitiporia mediterranea MF3/22]EJD08047.1 hypothetical protein FOMMEDRAFT_150711 [Fomitiporia mediterranea MF3/22]